MHDTTYTYDEVNKHERGYKDTILAKIYNQPLDIEKTQRPQIGSIHLRYHIDSVINYCGLRMEYFLCIWYSIWIPFPILYCPYLQLSQCIQAAKWFDN